MARVPARLHVRDDFVVPGREIGLEAVRSSGPGGQHVNKTASRVQLRWDVAASTAPDEEQRARLLARLRPRPTAAGVFLLASDRSRSQHENVEDVLARFVAAVARALARPRPRRATRPTKASKERRLATKRRRGETKRARTARGDGGDGTR